MFGSGVFETWLKKLNRKMAFEKRKMLFLDNASSHPTVEYSNVKLQFFPPNTTSVLQPMDQGIIQATKLKFRKLQWQKHDHHYGTHKEKCASEIWKKIDALQAITWIKKAWDSVTPETIQKCVQRCGFQAGNKGEDGRFISFLYVCAGVTDCQKFAFLLNNKMLVTVIHYFLVLNYYNSHTGNKT